MNQATLDHTPASQPEFDIEFVDSAAFREPDAAQVILAPMPAVEPPAAKRNPPADTPLYLADLYAYRLLTREQEYHLFRQMHYLKYRASEIARQLSNNGRRTAELDQMQAFLSEALSIRNRIVECNLRLVVSIAKKLVDPANRLDDLISEGNGPLIRAVEIFDFERGNRFSTYATWAVRNHLYRIARRNRRRQQRSLTSTDSLGFMPDEVTPMPSDSADRRDSQQAVLRAIGRLDKRDRRILEMRFGVAGVEQPLLFREIAAKLNVSTERARQLASRALERLREVVGDDA